jgi:hypothetical protein
VLLDVLSEQRRELVGQVDDALRTVFGRLDLDLPIAGALHLTGHGQLTAQEVDVGDLDGRGLAEP